MGIAIKHANNWKGGRYKSRGYWYLYRPYTVNRNKQGYIREHIYIYQEFHKCCMLKWGNVHHINEQRDDNRIENLQGMTRKQHRRLHSIGNKFRKTDMSKRICLNCGSKTTYTDKKGQQYWFKVKGGFTCSKRPCRKFNL